MGPPANVASSRRRSREGNSFFLWLNQRVLVTWWKMSYMDALPSVQQKPFDYFGFQLVLLKPRICISSV
ncbi:hypothetical protein ABKV19_015873 [Rosa sericea]